MIVNSLIGSLFCPFVSFMTKSLPTSHDIPPHILEFCHHYNPKTCGGRVLCIYTLSVDVIFSSNWINCSPAALPEFHYEALNPIIEYTQNILCIQNPQYVHRVPRPNLLPLVLLLRPYLTYPHCYSLNVPSSHLPSKPTPTSLPLLPSLIYSSWYSLGAPSNLLPSSPTPTVTFLAPLPDLLPLLRSWLPS